MILGYKSFSYNGYNQFGEKMIEGKNYHCSGIIKYNHNGYHMSHFFEDTIPFSDKIDEEGNEKLLHNILIAEVIGYGNLDTVSEYYSDYYGFYDMYACSDIKILRFIPRDELINMALKLNELRMERFVKYCYLTDKELLLFRNIYPIVDLAIDYYHYENKKAYDLNNRSKIYQKYYNKNGRC